VNSKKEDKPMGVVGVVEESVSIDAREQLVPKQVKQYAERRGSAVEYNNGTILVRSKHPLDQCARRGIIEDQHYDTGKAFITIRDCAFANTHGRIYNDTGEGDSGIDAATLYANTWRKMTRKQWQLIALLCFAQPKPDGEYFTEADYRFLYGIASNIQSAFEALDRAVMEARKEIKAKLKKQQEEAENAKPA
jgi:hypothetical protein